MGVIEKDRLLEVRGEDLYDNSDGEQVGSVEEIYLDDETDAPETVPVKREEIRVEREPITDANTGDAMEGSAISEEEHERTVSEDVRRQEIDIDEPGGRFHRA